MLSAKTKNRLLKCMGHKSDTDALIAAINSPGVQMSGRLANRVRKRFGYHAGKEMEAIIEAGSGSFSKKARHEMISDMAREQEAVELMSAVENQNA